MRTRNIHIFIRTFIILLSGAIIFGYTYFRTQPYLNGPQITIESPYNGITVTESPLILTGNVERISEITLNGRQIFTNTEGVFTESVFLHPGYNVIKIEAIDRFDKHIDKQLQVIYLET